MVSSPANKGSPFGHLDGEDYYLASNSRLHFNILLLFMCCKVEGDWSQQLSHQRPNPIHNFGGIQNNQWLPFIFYVVHFTMRRFVLHIITLYLV